MRVCRTVAECRQALAEIRGDLKVGFVPTMGALHRGHLSLVERCAAETDLSVVSIYVNPTQFGPKEDLGKYPRDLERDLELLDRHSTDLVFLPDDAQMYPPGFRTWVEVEGLSDILCGASRPGHFKGVATVVLKLTQIVKPELMFMGLKDFQQLVVLERMLQDLNSETRIARCPIIREEDGLALSSRNVFLDPEERIRARCLSQAWQEARNLVAQGCLDSRELLAAVERILLDAEGRIDYIKIVDSSTLTEVDSVDANSRILLAVFIGTTRLIDNSALLA